MAGWTRARLGWVTEVVVVADTVIDMPPVETADTVFILPTPESQEYFLLENRQALGADQFLRGAGLLIWHVDPERIAARSWSNSVNAQLPYGLALEQADGLRSLQGLNGTNSGDGSDPFPGNTNNTTFSFNTNPPSVLNDSTPTYITVDAIEQLVTDGPVRARISYSRPTVIAASDTLAAVRVDGVSTNYFDELLEDGIQVPVEMNAVQVVDVGSPAQSVNLRTRYTWMSWSNGMPRSFTHTGAASGDTIIAEVARDFSLAVLNDGDWLGQVTVTVSGDVEWEAAATPPCDPVLCRGWVAENTAVVLQAETSNPALLFEGWLEVDPAGQLVVVSDQPTHTVTMTRPLRAEATFVERLFAGSATLDDATMGALYNDTLLATGGLNARSWRVLAGTLPQGTALGATSGTVTGRPVESGAFPLTLEVTSGFQKDSVDVTFTVVEPPLAVEDVVRELVGLDNTLTRDEEFFLDIVGNANGALDLGDVLAWIEAGAVAVSPELLETLRTGRIDR
jgi:hypothetical protein